jgi:hypothetical protein
MPNRDWITLYSFSIVAAKWLDRSKTTKSFLGNKTVVAPASLKGTLDASRNQTWSSRIVRKELASFSFCLKINEVLKRLAGACSSVRKILYSFLLRCLV